MLISRAFNAHLMTVAFRSRPFLVSSTPSTCGRSASVTSTVTNAAALRLTTSPRTASLRHAQPPPLQAPCRSRRGLAGNSGGPPTLVLNHECIFRRLASLLSSSPPPSSSSSSSSQRDFGFSSAAAFRVAFAAASFAVIVPVPTGILSETNQAP